MKRWLVRIFVLLLLGAIVNIAVAWGLVWNRGVGADRFRPARIFGDIEDRHVSAWLKYAPKSWTSPPNNWFIDSDRTGFMYFSLAHEEANATFVVSGIPSLSMIGYRFEHRVKDGWEEDSNTHWRITDGGPDRDWLWLPLRPLWPGFAINTAFYATLLWLILFMPFALRKRRRIKRGLCSTCAYDLRAMPTDSNACPECGASVPPPLRAGVRGRVEHAS